MRTYRRNQERHIDFSFINAVRLHSAIGYITPADCLAGLSEVIGQELNRKPEAALKLRKEKRAATKQVA